ncbi:hypothetical protein DL98DRAFT_659035 [Cadophora sp. DSE1049]|nr:hypothetical protein DL98DRAFT_659035 [Cadophora sp. DSE1049]
MCDYEGDEDTIVVRVESDMNSRKPRKKLPQSRKPHSKSDHMASSEIPQESSLPRPSVATRDPKLDWPVKSNRHKQWPDEPREFVWRYMHRNGLYTQRLSDDDVMDLVQEINSHVGISPTDELHSAMCVDLKAFISSWTDRWHSDGLLIECWHPAGPSYRRTPKFDALLKLGPNPYTIRTAAGHASLPSQMLVTEEHPHPISQRRVRETTEDVPSQKRRKGDAGQTINAEQVSPRTANRLQTPPGSALGDDDSHSGSPATRSSEFDGSEAASPPPTGSGWVAINNPVIPMSSGNRRKSENIATTSNRVHSGPRGGPEHNAQISPPVDTASTNAPLSPTISPSPSSSLATSSPIAASTPPAPTHPRIRFIPQKRNLSLDFAHPLPSLRDLTVPEFFTLFAASSGYVLCQLHTITFDIIFARRSKLVLRGEDSEVEWRGLKRRISLLFRDGRRRGVEEGCWEVWVKEGEGFSEESEEEGDEFEGL